MVKIWSDTAWDEYVEWQTENRRMLKKINDLIKDIERNGTKGLGKSEKLKHHSGYSKRINKEHRLVFDIIDNKLYIASVKGHYEDIKGK